MSSEIGRALLAVELHSDMQPSKAPSDERNINCREVEFSLLKGWSDVQTQPWRLFTTRFSRSAQKAGFDRLTAGHLHAALAEMVDNALLHSNAQLPIVVGYHILKGFAQFSVADSGIGVLASLHQCADYRDLTTDVEAIRKALQDGVSRYGHQRGGFGFRPVFKAVASQWGLLRFRSGQGCIVIDGNNCSADEGKEFFTPPLRGFHVTISCCVDGRAPVPYVA
jgi:anti-sigma regulatory factor (Ser/Thr protein kinase)